MIEYKCTHSGQYRRYGDSYKVYEIKTDMSREGTIDWVFNNLHRTQVPPKSEWSEKIRYGGEKWGDMSYYFNGYYTLTPIPEGFEMTFCEPYAD